jgi:hypothetical protein
MRQYKLVIQRDTITAKLFVHNDNKVEIIDADDNVDADYLIRKQTLLKELVDIMRKYEVSSWKCNLDTV